jgi:hypothetical protein
MTESDSTAPYRPTNVSNNREHLENIFPELVILHNYFGENVLMVNSYLANSKEKYTSTSLLIKEENKYFKRLFDEEIERYSYLREKSSLVIVPENKYLRKEYTPEEEQEFYNSVKDRFAVYHFFSELLENKKLCESIDDSNLSFKTEDFKKPLSNINIKLEDIPENIYLDILRNHKEIYFKYYSSLVASLKENVFRIMEILESSNNKYQIGLDMPKINTLLRKKTEFIVGDYFFSPDFAGTNNYRGEDDNNLITLSTVLVRDKLDVNLALTHEIFHSISGRTFFKPKIHYSHREKIIERRPSNKTGLRFNNKNSFKWLNEAVTTNLQELVLDKKGKAYSREVLLLDFLANKGKKEIPMNIFYKAYFEPGNIQNKEKNNLYYWGQLVKQINSSYYPGILKDLDFINKHSIEYAIEAFKTRGNIKKNIKKAIKDINSKEDFFNSLEELQKKLGPI